MTTETQAVEMVQEAFPGISVAEVPPMSDAEVLHHRLLRRVVTSDQAGSGMALDAARATTEDELFRSSEEGGTADVVSSRDYLGIPFEAHRFTLRESDKSELVDFYMNIEGVSWENKPLVINTSSYRSAVQMLKAEDMGWLPKWLKFRETERPTKQGRHPLELVVSSKAEADAYAKSKVHKGKKGEEDF
jgi:hypothetical protein